MTPKERRTIILVLSGSLLAGLFLALQPTEVEGKITLVAGALVLSLVMIRTGAMAWMAFRKQRVALAALCGLLTGLFFLGLLGEGGKLLAVFFR